jgi:hypothetical protein
VENCLFSLHFKVPKEAPINHHSQYRYHKFLCQPLFYSFPLYPACFLLTHELWNVIKFVHFSPKFTQLAPQKLWNVCDLYFIKHGLFCFSQHSTVLPYDLPYCRKQTNAKVMLRCWRVHYRRKITTPKLAVTGRKPKFHSPKNLIGFLRARADDVNFHGR